MSTHMRRYSTASLALSLLAGILIVAAPPAGAGCQPFGVGGMGQLCDGPVQPDGTWHRCEVVLDIVLNGTKSTCYPLGGNHFLPPFQPPGHIDP